MQTAAPLPGRSSKYGAAGLKRHTVVYILDAALCGVNSHDDGNVTFLSANIKSKPSDLCSPSDSTPDSTNESRAR